LLGFSVTVFGSERSSISSIYQLSPDTSTVKSMETKIHAYLVLMDRLTVEARGLMLPCAQSVEGDLNQHRGPEITFTSVTLPVSSTNASITITPCTLASRAR